MSGLKKDAKRLKEAVADQGFRVEERSDGWMVYGKEPGSRKVMIHKTPSSQRTLRNKVAELRRLGFEWKGR